MREHNSDERRSPQPVDELQHEQVRRWLRELLADEFTEEQAVRLVFAKLLYSRGRLRD